MLGYFDCRVIDNFQIKIHPQHQNQSNYLDVLFFNSVLFFDNDDVFIITTESRNYPISPRLHIENCLLSFTQVDLNNENANNILDIYWDDNNLTS